MVEREMQELLWHHPERLLNEPLKPFAWETSSSVGRADLVFEDRLGRLLIIEVKHGKLGRAIDQLLDYFGMMKDRFPNRPVELMVVANSIPSERRLTCESRDIECREISEKTFREVAFEVGYTFRSEVTSQLVTTATNAPSNGADTKGQQLAAPSQWAYHKAPTTASSNIEDFLLRCDEKGRNFFEALFSAQKTRGTQSRITWNHESGFSLQFYFHRVGFAPMVWGFPARNREGRNIQQRLHFPFDFSLKAGVPQAFVNEFGASLSSVAPFSGGGKRPSITIDGLNAVARKQIIDAIFDFAGKAAAK